MKQFIPNFIPKLWGVLWIIIITGLSFLGVFWVIKGILISLGVI